MHRTRPVDILRNVILLHSTILGSKPAILGNHPFEHTHTHIPHKHTHIYTHTEGHGTARKESPHPLNFPNNGLIQF